jgi:DNA modification methylase
MIIKTDCLEGLKSLAAESINCIVTSPPYNKKGLQGTQTKKSKEGGNQIWKKFEIDYSDYGDDMSEEDYQLWMIEFLNECHRVIKKDGSIFFNHKPRRHKNRVHLPTDFISKSDVELFQLIIWDRRSSPNIRKENLVPCTEHIYWFCKDKPKTFRDNMEKDFIGEVWKIPADKQKSHPAPFPTQLVKNCILLTTEKDDLVLDPFMGSGTTALVSESLGRKWLGYEMSESYIEIAKSRIDESIRLTRYMNAND